MTRQAPTANGQPPAAGALPRLRHRHILVVGGTGFLGSVVLSLLMRELPALGRLDVLVRRRPGMPGEKRFRERVLPDEAFDPVRARLGDRLEALVEEKVRVLEGDLSEPDLGFPEEVIADLEGSLALVINASGLVDFHAPLGRSYRTNILGTEHLLGLCRRTGAGLVHTSTAFVAGERTGRVPETVETGWFPRKEALSHLEFDPEAEIADIRAALERIDAEMASPALRAEIAREAAEAHRAAHGVEPAGAQLETAIRRALRDRRTAREVEAGRKRAEAWGWPNVYTYSKSLGEQRIAASDVPATIVRPTIVESALAYPEPGWNRNATTTAPLIMLALSGFRPVAAEPKHILDIIPVDQVAWTLLAAGAALLEGGAHAVHHAGSSDRNPFAMRRLVDLVGIYLHERALEDREGADALVSANQEPRLVDADGLRLRAEWTRKAASRIERLASEWGDAIRARRIREVLDRLRDKAEAVEREIDHALDLWDIFLPFAHDLEYRFETGHAIELAQRYGSGDGEPVFDPEAIDWRSYWLDVHIPGLRRWVLAEGGASRAVRPRRPLQPLPDRVRALGEAEAHRRAASFAGGGRPHAVTYGEAWRASGALRAALAERLDDLSGARVAVAAAPDTAWWIGLLAVTSAGATAVLAGGETGTAPEGCAGLLRVEGPRMARWTAGAEVAVPLALDPSAVPEAPAGSGALAFAFGATGGEADPVPLRTLAPRLTELLERLDLPEAARVLLPLETEDDHESYALGFLVLALLDHGATIEAVARAELVQAARSLRIDAVVATESVWPDLARLGESGVPAGITRLIDLAPGGETRTRAWQSRGLKVVQLITGGSGDGFTASRTLDAAAGLDEPFEALPPYRIRAEKGRLEIRAPGAEAWSDAGWRAEPAGRRVRLRPRLLTPGSPVPLAEVFRAAAVAGAEVRPAGGRGGVKLVVTPDPDRTRTLQDFRRALLRDVGRHNQAAGREERIVAVAATLNGDLPAGAPEWIPTRSREEIDDVPPVAERAAWAAALLATRLSPESLDLYRRALDAAPVDDVRLEAWERVILGGLRTGDLHGQAFVQAFDAEVRRAGSRPRRLLRKVRRGAEEARAWGEREDPGGPLLPDAVTSPVRGAIGKTVHAFYRHGMKVNLRGAAHVPVSRNFLVVANHSSHLDGGLVKYALGPWRERVHALAAKDYFFGTPGRRFFAHHFTRLIPTERTRVTSEWMRKAKDVLAMGDCVLIFPEGTRTSGPEVGEFKASLGTLVRTLRVPVLPILIEGSWDILPKGKAIPRGREVTVHVGPLIEWETVESGLGRKPTLRHDRWIAESIRSAVVELGSDVHPPKRAATASMAGDGSASAASAPGASSPAPGADPDPESPA